MNESYVDVYTKDEVVFLSIFSIVLIIIAVPANFLVLVGYVTSRPIRAKPSSNLLASLTVADLFASALVTPFQLAFQVLHPSMVVNRGLLCSFVGSVTYSFYIVITQTLVCMSVDRFYAIRFALRYQSIMTRKRVAVIIVFTWLHSIIFVLLLGPFAAEVDYNPRLCVCGIIFDDRLAMLILMALVYSIIPFVIMVTLNCKVALCLRRHNRRMMTTSAIHPSYERNGRTKTREAQERKVACMVCWQIIACFICWTPVAITSILQLTPVYPSAFVSAIAYLILHMSEVINPVLNLIFRKDIRDAIIRFCSRSLGCFS